MVVNPAYNLEEDVLKLRVATEITEEEPDTSLEIGINAWFNL